MFKKRRQKRVIPRKIGDVAQGIALYDYDGNKIYLVDGVAFNGKKLVTVKYGLAQTDLGKYAERGQAVLIAQFYKLVPLVLNYPTFIFKGLKRPLRVKKNMNGDVKKRIHSSKLIYDYDWEKGSKNEIVEYPAPIGKIYVVIVTENEKIKNFPLIYGWIERWNWVDEDGYLNEAPINWVDRYDFRVYSKQSRIHLVKRKGGNT